MKHNVPFWLKLAAIGLMTLTLCFAQYLIDHFVGGSSVNDRLIAAAASGDRAEMDWALQEGASPLARDEYGSMALAYAAQAGDMRGAQRLLDAGAPIDATDDFGRTPLMIAASGKSLAMVKFLIERGADPGRRSQSGITALQIAAQSECDDIAGFLRNLAHEHSVASVQNP